MVPFCLSGQKPTAAVKIPSKPIFELNKAKLEQHLNGPKLHMYIHET